MKSKTDLVVLLIKEGLLDLRRAAARRLFNDAILEGWENAEKHSNFTRLQNIADAYDDRAQRARFIQQLRLHLPIGRSKKSAARMGIDPKALNNWQRPDPWPDFTSVILSPVRNSNTIQIDVPELTAQELLSCLMDHVVLNRRSLSASQIDDLIEILQSVRTRITSTKNLE
ncbi:MAG: hypothetical protein ABJN24_01125 [Hyphomicrobiales bacterium]